MYALTYTNLASFVYVVNRLTPAGARGGLHNPCCQDGSDEASLSTY
jgi:hypothetical protein